MLSFLVLGSCEKNTIDPFPVKEVLIDEFNCPSVAYTGVDTSIIGKWKLMQWNTLHPVSGAIVTFHDYSCEEIVYEFRSDKTLIITGDHQEVKSGSLTYSGGGPFRSQDVRAVYFYLAGVDSDWWTGRLKESGAVMDLRIRSHHDVMLQFIRIQ